MILPSILYQDDWCVVIHKPAGLVVNLSETVSTTTLEDWVESKHILQSETEKTEAVSYSDFQKRAGIVHRLDKETSGIVLVGRTEDAFRNLQSQFKERTIRKKYITLVHGRVAPDTGTIAVPVGRLPWKRDRFGVFPDGRESETAYKVLSYYQHPEFNTWYSLLHVFPKTGRTHQIRVHMQYMQYPLVSDTFYTGKNTVKQDMKWCPRLFLHAQEIEFFHKPAGKNIVITSSLPADLYTALSILKKEDKR